MTSKDILSELRESLNYKPKDDDHHSYYTVNKERFDGNRQLKPVQIRISNHGTYLRTWLDFVNKKDSEIRLLDPSRCINFSIVFIDENANITNDCVGRKNCDDCDISCIPTLVKGITQKGRSFEVYQYVYQTQDITKENITKIIDDVTQAYVNGKFDGVLATKKPSFKKMVPWEPQKDTKGKNNKNTPIGKTKGKNGVKDSAYDGFVSTPINESEGSCRQLDNVTLIRLMLAFED